MGGERALFVMLCLLFASSPQAGAGTADDPDLVDPAGDIQVARGPLVHIAAPEIDILAVWVEADDSTVRTTFQVLNVTHRVDEDESILISLFAEVAPYRSAGIVAQRAWGEWVFYFTAVRPDGSAFTVLTPGGIDAEANRVVVDVPRTLLNATLYDARASGIIVVSAPGDVFDVGGGTVWFRDWVPNEGPGPTIPLE